MRLPHCVRALVLTAPVSLAAQSSPHVERAASNGKVRHAAFIPARLDRIDALLQQLVHEGKLPGATALIVHDGEVVYDKAFGYRDLGTKAPLRTTDIFRIASQTKAITSLAAMMLWEERKFSLDDPVAKYLPEFEKPQVLTAFNPSDSTWEAKPARRPMTVRQLFTHTSGLDYAQIGSDEFNAIYAKAGLTALGEPGHLLADKMRVLGRLPLKHEPGERFTYSLGVDLLGRLVEVWSGLPLDRFFRTRIFEPLGMHDTWFSLPADRAGRLVTLHREADGKLEPWHDETALGNPDYPSRPMTYFSGGGGLSSTTADYARFLDLFLNGGESGGVRLLGRKTVELMLTNHIPGLAPPFGLGFALETKENDFRSIVSEGTFSWGGAFATTYWVDPKERLVALVYTNVLGSTANLGEAFRVLLYAAMR
jgi:CubicO group peptidase (beta-lactamase class C family)